MGKYEFKPYSTKFNELYLKEKSELKKALPKYVQIEHVGSTSVPGLGGKGIIDIAIDATKENVNDYMQRLTKIGYEYDPHPGDDHRKFMQKIVKYRGGERRVHLHLTVDPNYWNSLNATRDYLRNHPDERDEYARIKKEGAELAKGDGRAYFVHKSKFIDELAKRSLEEARKKGKKYQLESIVTAGIASVCFLLSFKITGEAISNLNPSSSNVSGVVLFLIGLIGTFVYFKRK